MTLVDTSVWVDHLRAGDERLMALLNRSEVLAHPFVIGELACGSLRNRSEVLILFAASRSRFRVTTATMRRWRRCSSGSGRSKVGWTCW